MYKELESKLTNVLKSEFDYIMKNEEDKNVQLDKATDVYKMGKIIENFDELQPVIADFFKKKAEKEKWER